MRKVKMAKSVLSIITALAITVTMLLPAVAKSTPMFQYEKEATKLNSLGLYAGTSTTEFVPELSGKLTVEQGVLLLLKMFGMLEDANALTDEEVNNTLARYTDANKISSWAQNAVAYAVANNIFSVSGNQINPQGGLLGQQYAGMILSNLGYEVGHDFQGSSTSLIDAGASITTVFATQVNNQPLIRDNAVGIMYGSLTATFADSHETVIGHLVQTGHVGENAAITTGLLPPVTITDLETVNPVTVLMGEPANLPATIKATRNDKTTKDVPVKWGTVDTSKAGKVMVEGYVEGTVFGTSVEVTVLDGALITSITKSIINVPVSFDAKEQLPGRLKATLKDNTTIDVNITWNKSNIDTSKATVTPIIITGSAVGTSVAAIAEINVSEIVSTKTVRMYLDTDKLKKIFIDLNDTNSFKKMLPEKVLATLKNGTTTEVPVTWNPIKLDIIAFTLLNVNNFVVFGKVNGTNIVSAFEIYELKGKITGFDYIPLIVTVKGGNVILSDQITAIFEDGSKGLVYVEWGKVDTSEIRNFTVEGTVNGVDIKPSITIHVNAPKPETSTFTPLPPVPSIISINNLMTSIEVVSSNAIKINFSAGVTVSGIDLNKIKFCETSGGGVITSLQAIDYTGTTTTATITLNDNLANSIDYDGDDADTDASAIKIYFDAGAFSLADDRKSQALPIQSALVIPYGAG